MHIRYLRKGDLLWFGTSEAELYLLYMEIIFSYITHFHTFSENNLNAKQLPNHDALDRGLFFSLLKSEVHTARIQRGLSIVSPQLPGSTLDLGGPRGGSVAQPLRCCQPPMHTRSASQRVRP